MRLRATKATESSRRFARVSPARYDALRIDRFEICESQSSRPVTKIGVARAEQLSPTDYNWCWIPPRPGSRGYFSIALFIDCDGCSDPAIPCSAMERRFDKALCDTKEAC